jgi:hypothetical protein
MSDNIGCQSSGMPETSGSPPMRLAFAFHMRATHS